MLDAGDQWELLLVVLLGEWVLCENDFKNDMVRHSFFGMQAECIIRGEPEDSVDHISAFRVPSLGAFDTCLLLRVLETVREIVDSGGFDRDVNIGRQIFVDLLDCLAQQEASLGLFHLSE